MPEAMPELPCAVYAGRLERLRKRAEAPVATTDSSSTPIASTARTSRTSPDSTRDLRKRSSSLDRAASPRCLWAIVVTLRLLPVAALLALGFVSAQRAGIKVRPESPAPSPTSPNPSGLALPSAYSSYVAAQSANAKFSVRYDQA